MESEYLRSLSVYLKRYRFVLIYGAGGVAENLLILMAPYIDRKRIFLVVSKKGEKEDSLAGYPVRQIDEFIDVKDEALVILAVMPRLALEIGKHIRDLGFQNYTTAEKLCQKLYDEIWKTPICKNKIVFSSWSGGDFGGNGKYIARNLMKHSRELDLVWVVKRKDRKLPEGIRGVLYGTYEHYQELGTARIWVDNEHKNFFTRKREGQSYIQTWHGGGPLKKIEFDGENISRSYLDLCEMNSEMEDIMISPSRFNSGLYRTAFHYTGEIMECGYPRNDIFWQDHKSREKLENLFQVKPEEMMVLYAPTFRNFQQKKENMPDLSKVCKAVAKRFGKRCRMFVRFHPSDAETAKKGPWIEPYINVTSYGDVQELLAASDILLTDYSSIMWDFSLSGKPVFLFHPDTDLYEQERGYYLPFEKMPYVEAFDTDDLCKKIETFDGEKYRKEIGVFIEEYGSFDQGTAAEAVGDRIRDILKEERGRQ